jgi:hypothetical protein
MENKVKVCKGVWCSHALFHCQIWYAHGFTVPRHGPQDGPCRGQASKPLRWSGKDHKGIARIYACMKCNYI